MTGRFRLNVGLPITFDGHGKMEVDLLCAEAGIVIELDGAQHFADAEAYRRDRRKDALLQQNGYFVLRFLTEDVEKHLDQILDTILAALVHREKARGDKPLFGPKRNSPAPYPLCYSFDVETIEQLSNPPLARRLGDTAHVSPLLRRVCHLSGCTEERVGE